MILHINGMTCGHCVAAVEKALKTVRGLKDIKVEIGKAVFKAPEKIDVSALKKAVEDAGYEVASVEKD